MSANGRTDHAAVAKVLLAVLALAALAAGPALSANADAGADLVARVLAGADDGAHNLVADDARVCMRSGVSKGLHGGIESTTTYTCSFPSHW
jgi:hypothetical protein